MSGAAGLIGGVVGAVIGVSFGNPQLGWLVGSSIGGLFAGGPKTSGPELADLRPQASEYGRPIPIIYSSFAVGGNVIWASDLIKVSDGDSGGKGGSSPTGPRYAANFAVLIGESPDGVLSLGRIWAGPDKRLIYDPAGTQFESGALTFYNGAEDQMPSPLIESYLGAGQVPAYRGYAYITVEMFDVTEHDGSHIPFLTIEVGRKGQVTPPTLGQFFVDGLFMGSSTVVGTFWGTYFGALQHSAASMTYMHRRDITLNEHGLRTVNLWDDARDTVIRVYRGGVGATDWLSSHVMGTGAYNLHEPFTVGAQPIVGAALNVGPRVVVATRLTGGGTRFHFINPATWAEVDTPLDYDVGSTEQVTGIYSYGYAQGGVFGVTNAGKARFYALSGGGGASSDVGAAANTAGDLHAAVDPVTQALWTIKLTSGTLTWSVHNASGLIYSGSSADIGFHDIARQPIAFAPDGVYITGNRWLAVDHFAKFDKNTGELLSVFDGQYAGTSDIHAVIWNPVMSRFIAYRENGYYSVSANSTLESMPAQLITLNGTDASMQAQTLAEIVTDLSLRAGLTLDQIDVGELTDTVDGYILANQVTVRDAISALMPVYYFDCVEDQGVLRFPKRGGEIIEEIPDDDLGAHGSDEDVVDLYQTTRSNDDELPHTFSVNYVLAATKYSPATKYARHMVGYSGDEARMELPMVLTDAKAQEAAEVNLHAQWVGRITYTLSLGRKYSHLMPSDLIGVQGYVMRITKQTHKENGVIELEAVQDDSDTYTPVIIVEETPPPDESVNQPSLTLIELLDINALRDADADPGFYAAACAADPNATTWSGCQVFVSVDGGATYTPAFSITTGESTMGVTTDALPDFHSGNIPDELSHVNVRLSHGSLSSTTTAGLLAGVNTAVIGDEIIHFRDATLESDGTYTLRGLLRGRRGCEYAMKEHAAGDRFVLVDPSKMVRVPQSTADVGIPKLYKAVTNGMTLASASEREFTNNGTGLKPYAPVHLGGGRNAAGDVILTWVRRDRISGEWRNEVDVPMSEAVEKYKVQIFAVPSEGVDFNLAVRTTYDVMSPTLTYTAAEQTADFGGLQATVYFRVYQVSATIGYGHPADGGV